jgi:hypothetical protein
MDSPKKVNEAGPRPPARFGAQEKESKNGQQPELHFDYAIDESGHMEIGSGSPTGGVQNAVPGAALGDGTTEAPITRGELWMRRLSLAVFVVLCVWVGLILVVLPWTHAWTDNGLLLRNLSLRSIASLNFVRGLVSGLGLINVWMGISEAVNYREPNKSV